MSAANPFLGKWELLYVPRGGGSPQLYTWESAWGPSNLPNFYVYQDGPVANNMAPAYWILPDFKSPSGWSTSLPWLTCEDTPDVFGVELFFNDREDSPTPHLLKTVLGNPPSIPASANPTPNPYVDGPLSLWDVHGDGSYYVYCWAWLNPRSGYKPVQLATSFRVVSPGAHYIRTFYKGAAPPGTDFTYVDISGEDYSSLYLAGVSFANCLCTGTNFTEAVLSNTTFGGYGDITHATFKFALLRSTAFQGLDFTGVDFSQASLAGATFTGCAIHGKVFNAANLGGASFTDCNLTGADFSGTDLTGAKFTGCTMLGTVFNAAQLGGASFTNCDLTGADFSDFVLCSSTPSFVGSTLDKASFSPRSAASDLTGVNFAGVKSIAGSNFKKTKLLGTSFDKLALVDVDFQTADLTGTLLTNTDVRPAKFSSPPSFSTDRAQLTSFAGSTLDYSLIGANWSFLNLAGATIVNLPASIPNLKARSTVMWDLQLTAMNLANADFTSADLRQCDFSGSNLSGAVLTGAWLHGDDQLRATILSDALMENAILTSANLTGTQFTGAFLWGTQVTLAEATVVRTNFAGAYLAGVKFVDVAQKACQGVIFSRACLVNASFNGTNCGQYQGQPASFAAACLQGANFTDASLDGADLTRAAVAAAAVTVPATIKTGWPPQPLKIPLSASPTLGIMGATDRSSVCPNGEKGPCSASQQQAPDAPTSWPVQGKKKPSGQA
jgi:uncharacterized protein YjbI with pentapeptide repeats